MSRRIWAGMLLVVLLAILPLQARAVPLPTLYWGTSGRYVSLVQQRLQDWGYYTGDVDGVYGQKMYQAVLLFQQRNGLDPDGLVGVNTWAALGENPTPGGGAVRQDARSDDLDLLARLVNAEAMGEPYDGQVAVAAVILNRVGDARFPNTLAGVVYQTYAFEPVSNGQIYQPASDTAIRAARDALNGWDPSGGAVYFWNPAKVEAGNWVWSRPISSQIGNHVFAK
jgi:N-acetylmuramoyl-L-alanine amidase